MTNYPSNTFQLQPAVPHSSNSLGESTTINNCELHAYICRDSTFVMQQWVIRWICL